MHFIATFVILLLSVSSLSAATYNVDIFGHLPDGVTAGAFGSASTNACSPVYCAGGFNVAYSFIAKPGDTINFGSLSLGSSIFGDGRNQQEYYYVDENGQLQYELGTIIGIYGGTLGVSYEYQSFIPLFSGGNFCNSADPACYPALQSQLTTQVIPLIFTLPTGFIELGWTEPFTYAPPRYIGAVPEPSTWAMLLLGFCGVGLLLHRHRGSLAFSEKRLPEISVGVA